MLEMKLNEIYKVVPKQELPACGIREVKRILRSNFNILKEPSEDFDWSSKDLARRLVKNVDISLSNSNMGMLGGYIGQFLLPEVEFIFRLSNDLQWSAGTYGDDGSCLWKDKMIAPKIMQANGTWAIQFLTPALKGIGRALMARGTDGDIVIHNAYGLMYNQDSILPSEYSRMRQDSKVSMVAALLGQKFDAAYKKVDFRINGSNSNPVYINGSFGYLLGDWKDIRLATRIDMEYKTDIFTICPLCSEYFDDDSQLVAVDPKLCGGATKLCVNCVGRYQFICAGCGEKKWLLDRENVIETKEGQKVCSSKCASELLYRKCDRCGTWNQPGTMIWMNEQKKWVCVDCQNSYRSCIYCYRTDDITRFKKVAARLATGKQWNVWCCPECATNIRNYGNPKGNPDVAETKSKRARKANDES